MNNRDTEILEEILDTLAEIVTLLESIDTNTAT